MMGVVDRIEPKLKDLIAESGLDDCVHLNDELEQCYGVAAEKLRNLIDREILKELYKQK
jgi:hypothetical protein